MTRNKTAHSPPPDQALVTAAEWFAGGRRVWYDPGSARVLTEIEAAATSGALRTMARAALERALDIAHHCGARRIADVAREELVAVGAKPRREAITGRDALTASELRVARLAAAGQTNREIAQALFITTKTASAHLSRVYRKLGINRRSQLAKALSSTIPSGRGAIP